MSLTLAAIVADPERVDDVSPDELPDLIGEAQAVQARLWARLQASVPPHATEPAPSRNGGPDHLLTVDQVAERLGVDKRWVYRRSKSLPFTKKLSSGTLRFSERGLERWQERQ